MFRFFRVICLLALLFGAGMLASRLYASVLRRLFPAPLPPVRIEREVRVIEGWTVNDEADQLRALKPTWGGSANTRPFDVTLRGSFSFLRGIPIDRSLEGYLFPDTYRVWEDEMPKGLIQKQLSTFNERVYERFKDVTLPAPLKNMDQAIILASIVEKEVPSVSDRKIVAGVFLRRLKEGMALQSDATLGYITHSKRGRATAAELGLDSRYNSYAYPGLPPSPISNPGLSAIEAVFAPTPSTYRYFLTDKEGKVLYASSFEEHVRNKRRAGY